MQSLLLLGVLGVFCGSTQASPTAFSQPNKNNVHEEKKSVKTTIAFRQPGLQDAEALLAQISDPASPAFGQYLDASAIVRADSLEVYSRRISFYHRRTYSPQVRRLGRKSSIGCGTQASLFPSFSCIKIELSCSFTPLAIHCTSSLGWS